MSKKVFTATFMVGIRTCALVYDVRKGVLEVEWQPSKPGKDILTDSVRMEQYRAGRDKLLEEVARETGRKIAVAEV